MIDTNPAQNKILSGIELFFIVVSPDGMYKTAFGRNQTATARPCLAWRPSPFLIELF
jgi:hypothetical protein